MIYLSELRNKPFNRGLKGTFFPSFDFGVANIPTNSKSMFTTLKVLPLVARCKFSISEYLIGLSGRLKRKLRVEGARVDEQWDLRDLKIFLRVGNGVYR